MKPAYSIIIAIAFSNSIYAQVTSGKVKYQETVKLNIKINPKMAQFADMIPKEMTYTKVLFFNTGASEYQNESKNLKETTNTEDNMITMTKYTPYEKMYHDLKSNEVISQKVLSDDTFLVREQNTQLHWEMTDQQKTILGYPCKKAIAEKDTNIITAWFTTSMPVNAGPDKWFGLPGLVLEVEVGKNRKIVATSVETNKTDANLIVKPANGKEVTEEAFDAMEKKKDQELIEQSGNDATNIHLQIIK